MAEEQKSPEITLEIRKLYVGDMSVEVPHAPEIYQEAMEPEISLSVNHEIKQLPEENYYAVRLRLTITAKNTKSDDKEKSEKTIYLVEVVQSGIFEIAGLEPAQLAHALNVYCPTTLYPYAREEVSNAINRAGFPPLYLQPVNFDALYQQQLMQAQQQTTAEGGEA